jgi:hypothetical protein
VTRAFVASTCARVRSARRCSTCAWKALLDLRLEGRRIELGQELPLLDAAVEVGVKLRDHPRHLAADLDGRDGRERAGGGHGFRDGAAVDSLGAELLILVAVSFAGSERGGEENEVEDSS